MYCWQHIYLIFPTDSPPIIINIHCILSILETGALVLQSLKCDAEFSKSILFA